MSSSEITIIRSERASTIFNADFRVGQKQFSFKGLFSCEASDDKSPAEKIFYSLLSEFQTNPDIDIEIAVNKVVRQFISTNLRFFDNGGKLTIVKITDFAYKPDPNSKPELKSYGFDSESINYLVQIYTRRKEEARKKKAAIQQQARHRSGTYTGWYWAIMPELRAQEGPATLAKLGKPPIKLQHRVMASCPESTSTAGSTADGVVADVMSGLGFADLTPR